LSLNNYFCAVLLLLFLLCFSSCNQKENPEDYLQNIIIDCIGLIGKEVPDTYEIDFVHTNYSYEDGTYDIESRHIRKLELNQEIFAEIFISLRDNSGIIETCNISILFSDYLETKKYYGQLMNIFINNQWEYIKDIHKLKYPYGELYYKNGLYAGIYDPSSIPQSISMSFSIHESLDGFYD
jgi:hypothetical protein